MTRKIGEQGSPGKQGYVEDSGNKGGKRMWGVNKDRMTMETGERHWKSRKTKETGHKKKS